MRGKNRERGINRTVEKGGGGGGDKKCGKKDTAREHCHTLAYFFTAGSYIVFHK